MTNIGIILSDNSKERNCIGLALEIEERINASPYFSSRLLDLQDYKNDPVGLVEINNYDSVLIIVQETGAEVPPCITRMIAASYPVLNQLPVGILINSDTKLNADLVYDQINNLLIDQEAVLFDKKIVFDKIQQAFNSSYQIIDGEVVRKLDTFLSEYLFFISGNVPGSPNKVLSETL